MKYRLQNSKFVIDGHSGEASFRDVMKWQFGGGRAKWPRRIENKIHAAPPQRLNGSDLRITWIGHSTVLIQTAGLNIITDPFFSKRASPFQFAGPMRVRDAGIEIANLPPIDIILLSHNHYDHLDLPALRQLQKAHKPKLITPLVNSRYAKGFDTSELDWRQSTEIGDVRCTLMPTWHWSKRGFGDTNEALWGAFVIESAGGVIYFAADTGYGDGNTFKEVRERFGNPRLSLLPIGAYEPRWFMKPQHMDPEEAVQAHVDLGSRTSIAIHHGTVQLTNEAIDAPVSALKRALQKAAVPEDTFKVLDVGECIAITK
jgi:L-ascorbate metabolism protein UlaG (beta-lactamase superfamily)